MTVKGDRTGFGAALAGSVAIAALMAPAAASAQSAPPVPTREEIDRSAPPPIAPAGERVVSADDSIEHAPCPLAAPEFANVRVTLRSAEFSAAPGIDTAMLAPAWSDKVGQDLPIAVVCDIRDRAATLLRAKGYLAAVRVPPQTISDGIVRFDVLSARLARVEVRGEVIGEVTVTRTPFAFDANIQNFGSHDVGRWGGMVRARAAGLTGLGDLTTVSLYSTADFEEQQVLQLSHEMRVGGEGLRLGGSYTYAWTRPDVATLPLKSHTQIISLFAGYPLVLTQAKRIQIGGGLDIIDQDIAIGGVPLNRDRVRVFNLHIDGNWTDPASIAGRHGYTPAEPRWAFGASLEARQGVDFLGASKDCGPGGTACFLPGAVPLTRIEAKPDAFVLRANAQADWRPTPKFTLSVAPRAQWASDPLVAYEEFSGGNFTVGRGFDPGTVIGDSGVAVTTEARYGSFVPANTKALAIQPFAFFDAAWVWNKDSSFNGLNPQKLFSAGGGVRLAYGTLGRLDMTVAVPLNRPALMAQKPDPRFLLSLTTQFGVRAR
ncbi:hemin transporter [Sphingopyxis terrae subsp. terrae NBRC 15098]|uniref:Hemin transporter n=1 Tax=Sphingopyxis terrae subsp. terrae NBRC 15098 TaxID=1219058 RepID=A0A142W0L0_9SPHN|nr:ShlB/FhaC/HecB family hemolysin secretion/activation protein [Sphingopyxis terrae]AMU95541.1 hemin transporter [Sphingopyxis terrae subsp. terrae NBRC 15098]